MVADRRVTFVRKWLERAEAAEDEFDRFFSAWIALVVAAQRVRAQSGRHVDDDTDRLRVVEYFQAKRTMVIRALEQHADQMKALARRRGTRFQNAIVDTGNRELRDLFGKLSRHYLDGEAMREDELVAAIVELLNKVRNNVFHGIKIYDDTEDLNLLRTVNPLLLSVLKEAEGTRH